MEIKKIKIESEKLKIEMDKTNEIENIDNFTKEIFSGKYDDNEFIAKSKSILDIFINTDIEYPGNCSLNEILDDYELLAHVFVCIFALEKYDMLSYFIVNHNIFILSRVFVGKEDNVVNGIKYVHSLKIDLDYENIDRDLLFQCCNLGLYETIKFIIDECKFDPVLESLQTMENEDEETLIQCVISSYSDISIKMKIIEYFVEKCMFDINYENYRGTSLCSILGCYNDKDILKNKPMIEFLLSLGANANEKNRHGERCLDMASPKEREIIENFLNTDDTKEPI